MSWYMTGLHSWHWSPLESWRFFFFFFFCLPAENVKPFPVIVCVWLVLLFFLTFPVGLHSRHARRVLSAPVRSRGIRRDPCSCRSSPRRALHGYWLCDSKPIGETLGIVTRMVSHSDVARPALFCAIGIAHAKQRSYSTVQPREGTDGVLGPPSSVSSSYPPPRSGCVIVRTYVL